MKKTFSPEAQTHSRASFHTFGGNGMSLVARTTFLRSGLAAGATIVAGGLPLAGEARRGAVTDADVSKLYDAAKKEGTLTWWTAHTTQSTAERIRDAFKKKYPGIEVQFIRQTGQVVYQRLTQNLKSGVKECDVFATSDEGHMPGLKKMNALAEFVPADLDKLPAKFRNLDPDNTYQLGFINFVLLSYNPKKLGHGPQKWTDLLDPKYKGKITSGHPGFSGAVGNWAVAMHDKYGADYFTKFNANQPKIGRSLYDTVTDILSGERDLGAGPYDLTSEKKAAGSAIDENYPENTILVVEPVAVLKDAPHPNAARLFMNFYYSREYSQALVNVFAFPLRADVPSANGVSIDKLKYYRVPVDRLITGVPEMIARWREVFGV